MLWLKSLHVVAMVTWFAGVFYLPRLFVYHADTLDSTGDARFKVMERRLLALMTLGGTATVVLGAAMVIAWPGYLATGWLRVKLVAVAMLIAYHVYCARITREFAAGRNRHSARWYRVFNEVPSLLLVVIVVLAVAKPF